MHSRPRYSFFKHFRPYYAFTGSFSTHQFERETLLCWPIYAVFGGQLIPLVTASSTPKRDMCSSGCLNEFANSIHCSSEAKHHYCIDELTLSTFYSCDSVSSSEQPLQPLLPLWRRHTEPDSESTPPSLPACRRATVDLPAPLPPSIQRMCRSRADDTSSSIECRVILCAVQSMRFLVATAQFGVVCRLKIRV